MKDFKPSISLSFKWHAPTAPPGGNRKIRLRAIVRTDLVSSYQVLAQLDNNCLSCVTENESFLLTDARKRKTFYRIIWRWPKIRPDRFYILSHNITIVNNIQSTSKNGESKRLSNWPFSQSSDLRWPWNHIVVNDNWTSIDTINLFVVKLRFIMNVSTYRRTYYRRMDRHIRSFYRMDMADNK